jgi:hypothetical protein
MLPHEFEPRHYQTDLFRAHFVHGKKFLIQVNHRRSGKTKGAVNFVLSAAFQRVGVYYYIFPELKQARNVVWQGIGKDGRRFLDDIPKKLIKGRPNNSQMRIQFINGSELILAGGDRYDKLMGTNPAGIILDEYSIMNPLAWHYLSPIITENDGWALFPYTPRGANHGYELYKTNLDNPDWFVQKLNILETFRQDGTPVVPEEKVEARRRSGMPEELIQQEFYCSFEVALAGAFYSDEIQKMYEDERICDFEIDRTLPAFTAWDIGRRDPSSIWVFQPKQDGSLDVIGYYENQFKDMAHYIWSVRELALKLGVTIDPYHNFAPHDINVVEFGSGRSRLEQASGMGFHFKTAPKMGIMEGINAARMMFPKIRMHKTNCEFGLNALKQYIADEKGVPVHDWASHGADAWRILATAYLQDLTPSQLRPFQMETYHP